MIPDLQTAIANERIATLRARARAARLARAAWRARTEQKAQARSARRNPSAPYVAKHRAAAR